VAFIVLLPLIVIYLLWTRPKPKRIKFLEDPNEQDNRRKQLMQPIQSFVTKYASPLFLVIGVPIIFYMVGWSLVAWIFAGWMIIFLVSFHRSRGHKR
jgi:hypothetical protein